MNIKYNVIYKLTHIYTNIYIFNKYNKISGINILKINIFIKKRKKNMYESDLADKKNTYAQYE